MIRLIWNVIMIYKDIKVGLFKIFILSIKINIYVCDKNVEIIVIMIEEIKN